jgi:lipopolysaccharide export system permease protein
VVIVSVIVWLMQSMRFLKVIMSDGACASEIAWMIGGVFPQILIMTAPISFLLALIWRYFKTITNAEKDVLESAGATPFFFAFPGLFMAGIVSAILYFFSLYLSPHALYHMRKTEHVLKKTMISSYILPGVFLQIDEKVIYVDKQIAPLTYEGVFIYDHAPFKDKEVITGRYAHFQIKDEEVRIIVYQGSHQKISAQEGKPPMALFFQEYMVNFRPKSKRLHSMKLHEKTFAQMQQELDSPETSSDRRSYIYAEIQQRFLLPILPLIFAAWISWFFFYLRYPRKKIYSVILYALLGVVFLEFAVLSALNLKVSFLVSLSVYFLCAFPFFLWIYTWIFRPKIVGLRK